MSKRSSVFMAAIALLSAASCQGNTPAANSVTSTPVSEKSSEVSAKTLPVFTATIAGHKYDGTPIVTPYSGDKVKCSYTCTSDGAVTQKWYKGKEELKEAPKDIGEYTYYLSVEETATYKSASAQFSFTIVTANVATKPWSDLDDPTCTWIPYDGKPHSLEVKESEYYTVTGNNEATEPGDYPFTATLKPGYAWIDGTTESVTHHLKIRKEYNETMRTVVARFEEVETDCMILISGTEFGKIFTGMQVALIDDYGIVFGTATVAVMANAETEEVVTEVGPDKTEIMIKLDHIDPSVIANKPTKTYLISIRQKDYHWEPTIIKEPTTSSKGVAAFVADEDPKLTISVDLPALSADDYYISTETPATCTSKGVNVYRLKDAFYALHETKSGLDNVSEYVESLERTCVFKVEVPPDPTNHAGPSYYKWSGAKPTYSISPSNFVLTNGEADEYCGTCNNLIKAKANKVEYTKGKWVKNTEKGTYDRVYTLDHGTLKGDIGRDKWNVHVDTTDVTTMNGAFKDATPKATGLDNRTIHIVVSQYEKTGFTFDSITYYVDGASQGKITKSPKTPESSRVYYVAGATDPYFAIRVGTHIDEDLGLDEDFTGDVYVKINWTKDA